jgi:hypothetical protein
MYQFVFYEDLNEEMVLDMEKRIDAICYPADTGCIDSQLACYRKNKRSRIALFNGKELIGYVGIQPITDETYQEMKAGVTELFYLYPDQIVEYVSGGHYRLYIDGFALLPEARSYLNGKRLFDSIIYEINRMEQDGIIIDEIISYMTDRGVLGFMKKQGFRIVEEDVAEGKIPIYSVKRGHFPKISENFVVSWG